MGGCAPAMDELGLSEALQAKHLIVGLQGQACGCHLGCPCKLADQGACLVLCLVDVCRVQAILQHRKQKCHINSCNMIFTMWYSC